ncbi:hypothetical protein E2C01_049219 [Portunus trituberculatus]|uniref:Uncharacterized protein n=1 Tax=Portunus trituberculatus TaxID=210409 RepID=A0A5B7GDA1_PORTR|nr:hypothetical protein [Portunus trituberculatus]
MYCGEAHVTQLLLLACGPEQWELLPAYAHSAFSSGTSKRMCAYQECSRALPNISHDPHTICTRIMQRGSCTVTSRCEKCTGWDVMVVDSARIYQVKLERRCTRYARAKHQGSVGASGSRVGAGDLPQVAVQMDLVSLVGSITPQDSASEAGQAECLASSRPTCPKLAAPSRVQEALLAKGAWEVAWDTRH